MDTDAVIRRAKKARPVRPFRLVTRDGRRIVLPEPERMANPPTGRQIILLAEGDNVVWLTPQDVTAVEEVPVALEAADGFC